MVNASAIDFFRDKTVTLLGLGLLGRGVGDATFLARHCKHVIVTDKKNANELDSSVRALKHFNNITFALGGHCEADFVGVDFVIKGAGVRLDNPYIDHAKKNAVPVYMSTALFASLASIKTIGVTGTRGKTTTTYMIAEILKAGGHKVLLGGNIRGVSTLALLDQIDLYDTALLELDSWQLQGFDDLKISPHISVFTNFYPDHMNYYDGDMKRYLYDKISIFRHQKPGDIFICGRDTQKLIDQQGPESHPVAHWIVVDPLPSTYKLGVPGTHNLANAALAKAVGNAYGLPDTLIDASLSTFKAVEGRLQYIGAWKGRTFYNDTNATTQEATLAALQAFNPHTTILIFGGSDKGLPLDTLLAYICENKIRCVLLQGTGSERVLHKLPHLRPVASMHEALSEARKISNSGDTLILSPAFASFGMFKNEYDRSDQFMSEVKKLIDDEGACPL